MPDDAPAPPAVPMINHMLPMFERRFAAAGCDAALIAIGCVGLFWSFQPMAQVRYLWIWMPSAVLLAVLILIEATTGVTIGKRIAGLRLQKRDGGAVPIAALLLRAAVKYAVIFLFVLGLAVHELMPSMMLLGLSMIVALCYVCVCYLMFMRIGRSMFDAAAGTVVERVVR